MTTAFPLPPEGAPAPRLALVTGTEPPFDLDAVLADAAPRLRRYAGRRLGDFHEAEELVQEALLRAYQHRSAFATRDDLMAWATVVTGRLVIDRLRVRGRCISVAEVPDGVRVGRDTADVVVARDEARLALDALEAMPSRQAAVLWAREVEGLSYGDIARRHDLTEPTVRSLLHRARRTLRREFSSRGGTVPRHGLVLLAPWLLGLRGLDRLRATARRTAAASAGVTVLGVGALLFTGPAPGAAGPTPAAVPPRVTNVAAPAPAVPAQAAPARAVEGTVPSDPSPPTTKRADSPTLNVPSVCGGVVEVQCSPPSEPVLTVGPALPSNPTKVRQIGVSSRTADCRALPTLPQTECRSGQS